MRTKSRQPSLLCDIAIMGTIFAGAAGALFGGYVALDAYQHRDVYDGPVALSFQSDAPLKRAGYVRVDHFPREITRARGKTQSFNMLVRKTADGALYEGFLICNGNCKLASVTPHQDMRSRRLDVF